MRSRKSASTGPVSKCSVAVLIFQHSEGHGFREKMSHVPNPLSERTNGPQCPMAMRGQGHWRGMRKTRGGREASRVHERSGQETKPLRDNSLYFQEWRWHSTALTPNKDTPLFDPLCLKRIIFCVGSIRLDLILTRFELR